MSSVIRHTWIEDALTAFRAHFKECDYEVPEKVRVSIGFGKGPAKHGKISLGQCFDKINSADGHYELFISPQVGAKGESEADKLNTINILETIAHEMVHATVGNECGHRGAFVVCAAAIGFTKPWKYTPAGEKILNVINQIIAKQGLFPTGAIIPNKPKQGKSLIKCQCDQCDFKAYITYKMMEEHGTPICPNDRDIMYCE